MSAHEAGRPAAEYDAILVEEAVALAIRGHSLELRYRVERAPCYEGSLDEREAAFRALHARWFGVLCLGEPLATELALHAAIRVRVGRVAVARAPSAKIEGADLFGFGAGGEPLLALGIALTSSTLAQPRRCSALLRGEMLHVADLLDPAFGFRPGVEADLAGPIAQRILRDRYRVLWQASVQGRLHAAGRAPEPSRDEWRNRLRAALPALETQAVAVLAESLLEGPRPTHRELLDLAARGGRRVPGDGSARFVPGSTCGACAFPTHEFVEEPESLPAAVLATIVGDVPGWSPDSGLCGQCAELYRTRVTATSFV